MPDIIIISKRIAMWIWPHGEVDIMRRGKAGINLYYDELRKITEEFEKYEERLLESVDFRQIEDD